MLPSDCPRRMPDRGVAGEVRPAVDAVEIDADTTIIQNRIPGYNKIDCESIVVELRGYMNS